MARLSYQPSLAVFLASLMLFQLGVQCREDVADQEDEKLDDLTPSERALFRTITRTRAIYPGMGFGGFGRLGFGGYGMGGLGYGGLGYGGLYGMRGLGGFGGMFFDENNDEDSQDDNVATINASQVEAGDEANDEDWPTDRETKRGKSRKPTGRRPIKPGKTPTRGGSGTVTLKIRFPREALKQVIKQFGFQCKEELPSIGDSEQALDFEI